ncbi:COR domain-containing protein [Donghicola sp. XS_ASV15]|uniref:COR domain-containing protein n=1 Tax=Donghicola sp. XS_ASV15 TaxID=3241295 RepID=UPI003514068F
MRTLTAKEAYAEAVRRIKAWQPGKALDLAIEGLIEIPECIGEINPTELFLTVNNRKSGGITGARGVSDLGPLSGLTALQKFDCAITSVSDLSPLSGLTALQKFDCAATRVSDLSPLSGLTALQSLHCGWTRISDLGPLSGLTALQSLKCWKTSGSDLSPLSGLTALQSLHCDHTRVSDLSPLSGLTALQSLHCGWTRVSDLSPLSSLTALQRLACRKTRISDLSPLSGITALQSLDCDRTEVSDLRPLSELPNLTSLHALLYDIAKWSPELFCREQIEKLTLSTLSGVPTEVLSQSWDDNCADRLRAHLLDLGPDPVALGDAKLLVLGNGRVGKTQLSRTLLDDRYDPSVASTHGIIVRSFDLPTDSDPEPRIQLWDFGGQDIYHATHTMFMKSRGMYLLAWTPEHEDNDTHSVGGHTFRNHQLPYWLNQINAFAGKEAPLIVVQTQADTLRDRRAIPDYAQAAYEGFSNALSIDHSAKTGRGQGDLNDALLEAYQLIDKPLIGKTRFGVKRALEDMIAEGNRRTMTLDEFAALCDAHGGVTRPDLFLETLHNAGVVFYRDGFFSDEIILDQQWAITAIYSVLERETSTFAIIKGMQGKFQQALLGEMQWNRDGYSPEEQELFISMMEACGICFEYEQSTRHTPVTYIAPDLLPETASPSWDGEDAGATQIRTYSAHPAALMRSVICAIGAQAGTKGEFWRTGLCVFEGTLQGWVRIEMASGDTSSEQIIIRTGGTRAAELLARIEEIVEREEGRLGFPAIASDSPSSKSLPKASDDQSEPALSYTRPSAEDSGWFFSYANADELADENRPVATFCEKVEREQGVKIRRDVNELKTGEAIEPFMRELSKGAKIYIWLTENYLRSPFCMFELHEIWKRSELEATTNDEARALFNNRVEVILGDVKIRLPTDIAVYRKFWNEQFEVISEEIKEMGTVDDLTVQTRNAINGFKSQTGAILRYVGSCLRETDFDKLT